MPLVSRMPARRRPFVAAVLAALLLFDIVWGEGGSCDCDAAQLRQQRAAAISHP